MHQLINGAEFPHCVAPNGYISFREATKYLSLSERSLRKLLPEIRHYRIGTKILFKRSDLDQWMDLHIETAEALDLSKIADDVLKGILGPTE